MSVFLSGAAARPASAVAMAARRTAMVAALSAADVVTAVAVNSGVAAELREGWPRYLPTGPAAVVFAGLTIALAARARWARGATILMSGLFSLLSLFGLLLDVVIVVVGASPAIGGTWYVPFRCAVAVLNFLLYLTILAVLTPPSEPVFAARAAAGERRSR